MTDSTGTLEKALERNLLKAKHDRSIALLDLTLGELLGYPFNFNETRIPRRRKCFRGSAQCNDEVNTNALIT